jgi:hypothetical protein
LAKRDEADIAKAKKLKEWQDEGEVWVLERPVSDT